jgi:hypothetical protein
MLIRGSYRHMGSGETGSDNRAFFVLIWYQYRRLSRRSVMEVVPGRRIIGTTQGQGVMIIGGYRQVGWRKKRDSLRIL